MFRTPPREGGGGGNQADREDEVVGDGDQAQDNQADPNLDAEPAAAAARPPPPPPRQEQLDRERQERERLERERRERGERERQERLRLDREQLERERQAAAQERQREEERQADLERRAALAAAANAMRNNFAPYQPHPQAGHAGPRDQWGGQGQFEDRPPPYDYLYRNAQRNDGARQQAFRHVNPEPADPRPMFGRANPQPQFDNRQHAHAQPQFDNRQHANAQPRYDYRQHGNDFIRGQQPEQALGARPRHQQAAEQPAWDDNVVRNPELVVDRRVRLGPNSGLAQNVAALANILGGVATALRPMTEAANVPRQQRDTAQALLDQMQAMTITVRANADEIAQRAEPEMQTPLLTQVPPEPTLQDRAGEMPTTRHYSINTFKGEASDTTAIDCRTFLNDIMRIAETFRLTHAMTLELIMRHTDKAAKNTVTWAARHSQNDLAAVVRALETEFCELTAPHIALEQVNTLTRKKGETITELRHRIVDRAYMAVRLDPPAERIRRENTLTKDNLMRCLDPVVRHRIEEHSRTRALTSLPPMGVDELCREAMNIERELSVEATEGSVAAASRAGSARSVTSSLKGHVHYAPAPPKPTEELNEVTSSLKELVAQIKDQATVRAKSPHPKALYTSSDRDRDSRRSDDRPRTPSRDRDRDQQRFRDQPRDNYRDRRDRSTEGDRRGRSRDYDRRDRSRDYDRNERSRDYDRGNDRRGRSRDDDRRGRSRDNDRRGPRPASRDRADSRGRERSNSRGRPKFDPKELGVRPNECLKCGEEGHSAWGPDSRKCRLDKEYCETTACPRCKRGGHTAENCTRNSVRSALN